MSPDEKRARGALSTLDSLAGRVDTARNAGDSTALGVVLQQAADALETLRSHHAAKAQPVKESVLNGNGH